MSGRGRELLRAFTSAEVKEFLKMGYERAPAVISNLTCHV